MKIGWKAVHLSKEPERLPVSEDVDTRGISSNIEDTNNRFLKTAAVQCRQQIGVNRSAMGVC